MEARIKHLEFIQAAIARMANHSFLLKGWSVTIVGGLLALSLKEWSIAYIFISIVVLLFFWLLDSYYLSRERLFVKLYNHVRKQKPRAVDFSMDTRMFENGCEWHGSARSTTMVLFYGGLFFVHLIMIHVLYMYGTKSIL